LARLCRSFSGYFRYFNLSAIKNYPAIYCQKWLFRVHFGNTMPDFGIQSKAIALASRLRTERKARHMSIADLADKAGIHPRTYSHFELTGEISLERLIRALMVLGRAEEIETLVRPSASFSSLDEMERRLTPAGGGGFR
jgi:hypothetical protein